MSTHPAANSLVALAGHDHPVQTLAFSPDGSMLASGDTGMKLRVWRGTEQLLEVDFHEEWDKVRPTERIRGAAFSRSGDRLFVAAGQRLVCLDLMAESGGRIEWMHIPPRFLGFLIISPIALSVSMLDVVAASFDNGTFGFWRLDGSGHRTVKDNSAPRIMTFIDDGQRLIGSDGFAVTIWDVASGDRVGRIQSDDRLFGFAASPIDKLVALRTIERIRLQRPDAREWIFDVPTLGPGLPLMAFSPSGQLLAATSKHAVQLLSLEGNEMSRIEFSDVRVVSMAFSPDGGRIAIGCSDGTIRFWPIDA